jgi:hypothetical protein
VQFTILLLITIALAIEPDIRGVILRSDADGLATFKLQTERKPSHSLPGVFLQRF